MREFSSPPETRPLGSEIDPELQPFVRELSGEQVRIIEQSRQSVSSLMKEYGYDSLPIERSKVGVLTQEGFEVLKIDVIGAYDFGRREIYVHERVLDNNLRTALVVGHEYIHQITEDAYEGKESLLPWRALNEGVVADLERELFFGYLRNNPLYGSDMRRTDETRVQMGDNIMRQELRERALTPDEIFLLRKIPIPGDDRTFALDILHFSHKDARNAVRLLWEKMSSGKSDYDQVRRTFIAAVPRRKFSELKKIVDSKFGDGFFEKLQKVAGNEKKTLEFANKLPPSTDFRT